MPNDEIISTATAVAAAPNSAHAVLGAIFDLGNVVDMTTAEIQLKRNNIPLPIFVTFAGPEHHTRKLFALNKQRRARQQLAKTGQMTFADPTEDEEEANSLMVQCAFGWRTEVRGEDGKKTSYPFVVFNGEQLPCDAGSINRLISDPKYAWFRKSLKDAFDDGEAFIKVSAST